MTTFKLLVRALIMSLSTSWLKESAHLHVGYFQSHKYLNYFMEWAADGETEWVLRAASGGSWTSRWSDFPDTDHHLVLLFWSTWQFSMRQEWMKSPLYGWFPRNLEQRWLSEAKNYKTRKTGHRQRTNLSSKIVSSLMFQKHAFWNCKWNIILCCFLILDKAQKIFLLLF